MGLTYNIDAQVEIVPAYTHGKDLLIDPLVLNYPRIKAQLQADLQSVTVTNSIRQPAGTFTLTLPPREVVSGYGWADLIRPYSLVTISLHRYGDRHEFNVTTPEPVPMMVGLVDHVALSEDYGSVAPRRSVQVTGRSLGALLTDIKWWYHHFLQDPNPKADVIPPDLRQFYTAPAPSIELLRDEVGVRALGFLAIDPNLWFSLPDRHPVAAMALAYDFFVAGLDGRAPFIKLKFQDGRSLSSRLLFQRDAARDNFFDAGARLQQQFLPSQMPQATCWDLMAYFAEPPFVEAFTDTFGTTAADAAVYLRVRKPPWLGHIGPSGDKVSFSNGTESPPVWGQSLFDTTYGEWDLSLDTVEIDGSDIIARPSLRRGLLGPEIFSAYEIRTQLGSPAGDSKNTEPLQKETPPLLEEQVDIPSNIYRYGIRPLTRTTKYIPYNAAEQEVGDYRERTLAYQALARTWFMWGPEFWSGQYTCKGRTAFRAGRRLYDYDLKREYYITAVVHRVDLASPQPLYTTALTVERGWDVTP